MKTAKLWTSEEDDILRRDVLEGKSLQAIASKIGRTQSAIRTRAYVLRLILGRPGAKRRGSPKSASAGPAASAS